MTLEVPDQIILGRKGLQTRCTRPETVFELGILAANVQLSMGLPGMTPQPLVGGESAMTMCAWPILLLRDRAGNVQTKCDKLFRLKPVESFSVSLNALQVHTLEPCLLNGRLKPVEWLDVFNDPSIRV